MPLRLVSGRSSASLGHVEAHIGGHGLGAWRPAVSTIPVGAGDPAVDAIEQRERDAYVDNHTCTCLAFK
jgi:hypothetical protein